MHGPAARLEPRLGFGRRCFTSGTSDGRRSKSDWISHAVRCLLQDVLSHPRFEGFRFESIRQSGPSLIKDRPEDGREQTRSQSSDIAQGAPDDGSIMHSRVPDIKFTPAQFALGFPNLFHEHLNPRCEAKTR